MKGSWRWTRCSGGLKRGGEGEGGGGVLSWSDLGFFLNFI